MAEIEPLPYIINSIARVRIENFTSIIYTKYYSNVNVSCIIIFCLFDLRENAERKLIYILYSDYMMV